MNVRLLVQDAVCTCIAAVHMCACSCAPPPPMCTQITNGTTTTTAAVAAAGGSGSTPVSPISSAATPAAAANNPSNLIDELLSLDMTDPPAPVGAPLGGGGGSVDPFAHSGSLDGLPLQPPGPIQPGGFHDHGGFGTNAFGGGAAAAAPPVAPAASVMPPSSGMCVGVSLSMCTNQTTSTRKPTPLAHSHRQPIC